MNNSVDAIVDRVETRVLGVVCGVLIGLGFCLFLLGLLIKKYPGINRRFKLMIYLSLILLHERLKPSTPNSSSTHKYFILHKAIADLIVN